MSTIQEFVSARRAEPWPHELNPFARDDGTDVDARELYAAYRTFMTARGEKPLAITEYGVWDVPGVQRYTDPETNRKVYAGLTVKTRAERAYDTVHDELFAAELRARADQPWVQLHLAHRGKHRDRYLATGDDADLTCTHDLPPDVIAGLADVEATIAPDIAPLVESRYGLHLRHRWDGPNPEWEARLAVLEAKLPALVAARDAAETELRSFDPEPVVAPAGGLAALTASVRDGTFVTPSADERAARLAARDQSKAALDDAIAALADAESEVKRVRWVLALGAPDSVSTSSTSQEEADAFATY